MVFASRKTNARAVCFMPVVDFTAFTAREMKLLVHWKSFEVYQSVA